MHIHTSVKYFIPKNFRCHVDIYIQNRQKKGKIVWYFTDEAMPTYGWNNLVQQMSFCMFWRKLLNWKRGLPYWPVTWNYYAFYFMREDSLERSMAPGCTSFALSCESIDNLMTPNPATFSCPPKSSKIFLAPYEVANIKECIQLNRNRPYKEKVFRQSDQLKHFVALLWL